MHRTSIATLILSCIIASTVVTDSYGKNPPTPPRKIFVVDTVLPTEKSRISRSDLESCNASSQLINAIIKSGPKNKLAIEKIGVPESKQQTSSVLRLEVDQLQNRTGNGQQNSRISINAHFLVSDGSPRAHNFDCAVVTVIKPPYINIWGCARFTKCTQKVGQDIAEWLTRFD